MARQTERFIMVPRYISRHGSSALLCGIVLCLCGLLFMTFCGNIDKRQLDASAYTDFWPVDDYKSLQKSTYLIVLILSSPNGRIRRDTIRETWLSNQPRTVAKYFAIGTQQLSDEAIQELEKENRINRDLLLIPDLIDDYQRLTLKVLKSFVWLDKNLNFRFLFKADEDTYARADMLLDALSLQYEKEKMLYWGFFVGNAHVYRQGQWAERDWNVCDRYLPYARGGGYVLSSSLVHYIALNSRLLKLYNSEDVSVGAWLAGLKVNRIHDPRFDTEYKSRGCDNRYVVQHKQSMLMMKEKFQNLRTTGRLCSREIRLVKSYIYNWDVLPSQCCIRNLTSVP